MVKRTFRSLTGFFAIAGFALVASSTPARAGIFGDVVDAVASAANEVVDAVVGLGEKAAQVVIDGYGNTITVMCSRKSIRGFSAICFDGDIPRSGEYMNRIAAGVDAVNSVSNGTLAYIRGPSRNNPNGLPERYSPLGSIQSFVGVIQNGASKAAQFSAGKPGATVLGSNMTAGGGVAGRVTILPLAYDYYVTAFGIGSLLVHEGDHSRFGTHSSGSSQDAAENGPYGTELRFLATVTRDPAPLISDFDRSNSLQLMKSRYGAIADSVARTRLISWAEKTDPDLVLSQGCVNAANHNSPRTCMNQGQIINYSSYLPARTVRLGKLTLETCRCAPPTVLKNQVVLKKIRL